MGLVSAEYFTGEPEWQEGDDNLHPIERMQRARRRQRQPIPLPTKPPKRRRTRLNDAEIIPFDRNWRPHEYRVKAALHESVQRWRWRTSRLRE